MLKSSVVKRSGGQIVVGICLLAFLLRIGVLFATSSYRVAEDDTNHFGFGWEMGRVASSLAQGHGFSSPLPLPTGPTAIVGPAYPLILALVFKLFGVYSTASAIAIRTLQCAFASLTCVFVYLCGRDSLGETAGRLAAVAWIVFPLNIFFAVTKVWETSLTGMLAAALFWFLLGTRQSLSAGRWAAAGAMLGAAALVNTSLVMLVVPFGLWALAKNRARAIVPVTVGALACLAAVSPWLIRNKIQFGGVMLRSNFPLEFRIGNNDLSYGQKMEVLHPSNNPEVNRHWQQVGEARFMAEERAANSEYLHRDLGRFVFSCLNRIVNYWTGAWIRQVPGYPNEWSVIVPNTLLTLAGFLGVWLMFRNGNPHAILYAGCMLFYPLVYYATTSQPRFYHSMTPLLVLSGSFWLFDCWKRLATARAAHRGPGAHAATSRKEIA